MTGLRLGHLRAAALVAAMTTTLAMLAATEPASAYTPEQQQACTDDAFRLCGSEIPDVDQVTACMVRNRTQLSPPCRAQFRPEPGETLVEERSERPRAVRPATKKKSAKAHDKAHKRSSN